MRAAWMTDLHLSFANPARSAKLRRELRALKPDVLFVTGDTGEAGNFLTLLETLRETAKVPLYYVLGNHDFYGSDIANVRELAEFHSRGDQVSKWLPGLDPVRLTDYVVLVGVDGWGDGRCGDPVGSRVKLNDWKYIQDLRNVYNLGTHKRIEKLRELGDLEAAQLRLALAKVRLMGECKQLIVLTHVPPFPDACIYDGKISDPEWRPWFTCVAVGEVLAEYAGSTTTEILVLCGHTHGVGIYQHNFNLEVRTGGWPVGTKDYGNPIIQPILELEG